MDTTYIDANHNDPACLRRHLVELESKLAEVRLERDDLARDVEALCIGTTGNVTFDSSSVLNERIFVSGMKNE